MPELIVKSPTDGPHYVQYNAAGEETHTNIVLIPRSETEKCEVFATVVPAGHAPAFHVHPDTEQVYIGIAGHGQVSIQTDEGEQSREMHPGDVCYIPRLTPHRSLPIGDQGFTYIVVDSFPDEKPPSHWGK